MIELVDYPGSSYTNVEDSLRDPIPAGGEKKVQVTNMTVGAAPEYVKMRAAIYADGTTSGVPEKVELLMARRRARLGTARELIGRLEKAKAAGSSKDSAIAALKQWFASLQPARRPAPGAREAMVQSASSGLVSHTIKTLDAGSIEDALIELRGAERDLAASKPAL